MQSQQRQTVETYQPEHTQTNYSMDLIFPQEILTIIFKNISLIAIYNVRATCKYFYNIINHVIFPEIKNQNPTEIAQKFPHLSNIKPEHLNSLFAIKPAIFDQQIIARFSQTLARYSLNEIFNELQSAGGDKMRHLICSVAADNPNSSANFLHSFDKLRINKLYPATQTHLKLNNEEILIPLIFFSINDINNIKYLPEVWFNSIVEFKKTQPFIIEHMKIRNSLALLVNRFNSALIYQIHCDIGACLKSLNAYLDERSLVNNQFLDLSRLTLDVLNKVLLVGSTPDEILNSQRNLYQIFFNRKNLQLTNLNQAHLTGIDFSKSIFNGSQFKKINAEQCEASHTNFINCDFSNATIFMDKFNSNNCSGSDFSNAELNVGELFNSDFSHANLKGLKINTRGYKHWRSESYIRVPDDCKFDGAQFFDTSDFASIESFRQAFDVMVKNFKLDFCMDEKKTDNLLLAIAEDIIRNLKALNNNPEEAIAKVKHTLEYRQNRNLLFPKVTKKQKISQFFKPNLDNDPQYLPRKKLKDFIKTLEHQSKDQKKLDRLKK